ncbi:hypothetical protein PsorP6_007832 [Peronosclerospora sorghi]|uniref:Uncharacterized protein n=1 Tax=Peronosclerospora sorghi TaxID=230839 RepID=A0ACC0W9D2_9STRA|nr:hypothetical protein PsorP6_007832 [Peronosclerospora sorghi]
MIRSDVLEKIRVRNVLLDESEKHGVRAPRVHLLMEQIRIFPQNVDKSESELLMEAINKAKGEDLSLYPSADTN